MKAYWDSSALVQACSDLPLRQRLKAERGFTRPHALTESFSVLTGGNLSIRLDADAAARTVENLARDIDFVELTPQEILSALKEARRRGVRGGRAHDLMHAIAAEKSRATRLLTVDENDFESLCDKVEIELV